MMCRMCEHARQAGKRDQTDIVGCTAMTRDDVSPNQYRGGNVYEGWLYSTRRPGDERNEYEPGLWLGALVRGVLVDSKGACPSFIQADKIIPTKEIETNE